MGGGRISEGVSQTKSWEDHMEEIEAELSEDLSNAKKDNYCKYGGFAF